MNPSVLTFALWMFAGSALVPSGSRTADGIAPEPRSVPDTLALAEYVGSEPCSGCHAAQRASFTATEMGRVILENPRNAVERLGCEGCHGPGSRHIEASGERVADFRTFNQDDPTPVPERNAVCLQCHEGGLRMDWAGSQHDMRAVACTSCHSVMSPASEHGQLAKATVVETCAQCHPREVRRQQMSLARMPVAEGKMDCTSCHNPHGTPNEKLLRAPSVNETCTSCHAEKRGPFLWEHAPVVESCANCHDPHGSRNDKMLVRPRPRLCQGCHINSRHPSTPYTETARQVIGSQCQNCHVAIHGSNHPAGGRFVR